MSYIEDAKVFKALCDDKRLLILNELRDGEKCVCHLMESLGLAQSALSYHMKILFESGIINDRQDGKWTHYSINEEGVRNASSLMFKLTSVKE